MSKISIFGWVINCTVAKKDSQPRICSPCPSSLRRRVKVAFFCLLFSATCDICNNRILNIFKYSWMRVMAKLVYLIFLIFASIECTEKFNFWPWKPLVWDHYRPRKTFPSCRYDPDCQQFCVSMPVRNARREQYQVIPKGYCDVSRRRCGCRIYLRLVLSVETDTQNRPKLLWTENNFNLINWNEIF